MKNITSFLKKFSNIKLTSRVIRKVVLDILKNKNIPITEDEIIYSNNVVYIKSNQIVKNEVFLSKDSILKEIEKQLKKKTVTDIR
ncbi:hypothetical protein ACFL6I_11565 [candidate division KSB1 bacterium]